MVDTVCAGYSGDRIAKSRKSPLNRVSSPMSLYRHSLHPPSSLMRTTLKLIFVWKLCTEEARSARRADTAVLRSQREGLRSKNCRGGARVFVPERRSTDPRCRVELVLQKMRAVSTGCRYRNNSRKQLSEELDVRSVGNGCDCS